MICSSDFIFNLYIYCFLFHFKAIVLAVIFYGLPRLTFGRVILRADMCHDEVIFQMSGSGLSCIKMENDDPKANKKVKSNQDI